MARGHKLIRQEIDELRAARAAGATLHELQAQTGYCTKTLNTYTKGLHTRIAKAKESEIINLLREYGSLCRKELAEKLEANANGVNNTLLRLSQDGAVERFKLGNPDSRRAVYFYRLTREELAVTE